MQKTSFWKAGHTPTLLASFFYFDLSFMVWVILGPLAVQISKDIGLTAAAEGPDGGDAAAGRRPAAHRDGRAGRPHGAEESRH